MLTTVVMPGKGVCAKEDSVPMLEAELLRVGLTGRMMLGAEATKLAARVALAVVGVGTGVVCAELEEAVLTREGRCCCCGGGGVW